MTESELREHAICSKCKKPIGHTGLPLFWTVEINRYGIKLNVVKRQDGLTALLGGHAGLAQIIGADEEMTEKMIDTENITLCETCALPIMELIEACNNTREVKP